VSDNISFLCLGHPSRSDGKWCRKPPTKLPERECLAAQRSKDYQQRGARRPTSAIKIASETFGYFVSIVVILVLLLGPLALGNAVLSWRR
jgi:hypothetical protein